MLTDGMTIALTLIAVDKVSRNVKSIINNSNAEFDKFQKKIKKTSEIMGTLGRSATMLGGGMTLAGGGLAYSLGLNDAIPQAFETEKRIREIGNVGNLTKNQMVGLNKELGSISKATNQFRPDILESMNFYTAQGITNISKLTEMSKIAGKVSTAENANIIDVATTAYRVTDNLKVPYTQLTKTMDVLAQSGKEGSFELKNMAQYFPQLTSSAMSLGMKGVPAVAQLGASLQIAMKGAGDAGQAANNFANFLQKVRMPDTFNELKKLEKVGFKGLTPQWETALKAKDPMFEIVKLVQKLNSEGVKTTQIFQDRQVLDFVNIMIPNLKEYERIKMKSLGISGVINSDYKNMMTTNIEQFKSLKISINELAQSQLPSFLTKVNGILTTINAHPILQKGLFNLILGTIGGGLILTTLGSVSLAIGSIADNYGRFSKYARDIYPILARNTRELLVQKGFGTTVGNFETLRSLKKAGNPLGIDLSKFSLRVGLLTDIKKIGPGIAGIFPTIMSGLAAIPGPGWAAAGIILAIAGTGILIHKYWKPLAGFFRGFFLGLKTLAHSTGLDASFAKLGKSLYPLIGWIGDIWHGFTGLFHQVNTKGKKAENFGGKLALGFMDAFLWIKKCIDTLQHLIDLTIKAERYIIRTVGLGSGVDFNASAVKGMQWSKDLNKYVPIAKSAGAIPKLAIGSKYITQSGIAYLHKGEAVNTASNVKATNKRQPFVAHFAPNITVNGNSSKEEIKQIVRDLFPEFQRMLRYEQERAFARSY